MYNIIIKKGYKLEYKHLEYTCYIGKNGLTNKKKEGDFKTPFHQLKLEKLYINKKNIQLKVENIPFVEITNQKISDDKKSQNYNREITEEEYKKTKESHENLNREDGKYDIMFTTDYNKEGKKGKGSCIFFHISGDSEYTRGCIAIKRANMLELIKEVDKDYKQSQKLPTIKFEKTLK